MKRTENEKKLAYKRVNYLLIAINIGLLAYVIYIIQGWFGQ
jgi:hypothetical protein